MAIKWEDLTKEQQTAIEKMAHPPHLFLTVEMANELKELGLAEDKLGGTGLSKAGKELYALRVALIRRAR